LFSDGPVRKLFGMCALEITPARKPGRPRDAELEARRRAQILRAATQVFSSQGYATAEVQAVADAIGVGKGTVYRYFPTKQDLFLATVDDGLSELHGIMDALMLDDSVDPVQQLHRAVREYLHFFARRPEMAELFIQERAAFGGKLAPRYFVMQGDRDCDTKHDVFFQRLAASRRLRNIHPETFITVLGDLLYGTVLSNHLAARPHDPDAQAAGIADVVLHGLLHPEAT
jgi:AcrR family transcriptional regulator